MIGLIRKLPENRTLLQKNTFYSFKKAQISSAIFKVVDFKNEENIDR